MYSHQRILMAYFIGFWVVVLALIFWRFTIGLFVVAAIFFGVPLVFLALLMGGLQ